MRTLILIAHNLRSCHNVGSLMRTCDGMGVSKLYLTGYTPYPSVDNDTRLPHLSAKITRQIAKTALGAEQSIHFEHYDHIETLIDELKSRNYTVVGLEQANGATSLPNFQPPSELALIVGREVEGLEANVMKKCDQIVDIPMTGRKESFNVSIAAAMALYHCRFAEG